MPCGTQHKLASGREVSAAVAYHHALVHLGLYNWLEEEFGATTLNPTFEGGDIPDEDIIDYDFPPESIARKMYSNVISLMVASCHQTAHVIKYLAAFYGSPEVDRGNCPDAGHRSRYDRHTNLF